MTDERRSLGADLCSSSTDRSQSRCDRPRWYRASLLADSRYDGEGMKLAGYVLTQCTLNLQPSDGSSHWGLLLVGGAGTNDWSIGWVRRPGETANLAGEGRLR